MSEPKAYEIRSVRDLLAIPDDKLEACLVDLAAWARIMRLAQEGGEAGVCVRVMDLPGKCSLDRFVWIDDGKHEAGFEFYVGAEQVAAGTVEIAPPEDPRA